MNKHIQREHIQRAESWVRNPRLRPSSEAVREVTSALLDRIRELEEMTAKIQRLAENRQVMIKRGNAERGPESGPGFGRLIPAVIVHVSHNEVECALLEDDDHAVCQPNKKGESGHWAMSQIVTDGRQNLRTEC